MSGNFTVCGEWSPCDKWCGNDNVDGAELMLIECCCLTLSKFFFYFALCTALVCFAYYYC